MIIFGITDEQKIIGISNPIDFCLNIENQINDSIKPRPDYSLKVNVDKTISLFVKRGNSTPYRYNGKAYKRNDTSTIEVDEIEEKRLIMLGLNISFEEIPIEDKELSFSFLEKAFITKLELSSFNLDVLKSLNLFDAKNGFNNAAKLLSDSNDFPGIDIDIAVFGNSFNIFKKRIILSGASILKQYYDSLEIYKSE